MEPKQENVPMPDQAGEAARQSRRRLLKAGAVGAPLILTFRSTSAWAVSAGCVIQNGTLPVPGAIVKADEHLEPVLKQGVTTPDPNKPWYDNYESVFISEGVGDAATNSIDIERLRSMVYNNNIGQTCLLSISGF